MSERVLLVGGGGREHELARQLSISDEVSGIFCVPGNAGTQQLKKTINVKIRPTAIDELVAIADRTEADMAIIGPEEPLVMGLSDRLRKKGLTVFGPSAEAAQLEASKADALGFMRRNRIPHPLSFITTSAEGAIQIINSIGAENAVIKADGLADGKGVVLPEERGVMSAREVAWETIYQMFDGKKFGGAGKDRVVIQERYHGPEVSAFVVSDGSRFTVLPFSQDHKRLLDNNQGPNTGGMGAYAPIPSSIISPAQEEKIGVIAQRTIEGMAHEGIPYQGLLYLGLMLAEEQDGDPIVIEYNVRFGDPETQAILPVLSESGVDVYDMIRSAAEGHLMEPHIPADLGKAAVSVCLAAEGYPDNPQTDQIIYGLDREYPGVIIHHAATERGYGQIVSIGGRVLYATGLATNVNMAARRAYDAAKKINFEGTQPQYRKDIGHIAW